MINLIRFLKSLVAKIYQWLDRYDKYEPKEKCIFSAALNPIVGRNHLHDYISVLETIPMQLAIYKIQPNQRNLDSLFLQYEFYYKWSRENWYGKECVGAVSRLADSVIDSMRNK